MSKKRRASNPTTSAGRGGAADEPIPVVSGREPCPCGSGRRYKACHGKPSVASTRRVVRPFAEMASEPDWVALHDMVPAATAPLTTTETERNVTLCTLLPMAWPALVRENGDVLLAAQTQTSSADIGRDLGDALRQALDADPGTPIAPRPLPPDAPHLRELIDTDQPLAVQMHSGFDFWLDDADAADDNARAGLERANAAIGPTARLASVAGAYWMILGERRQLRWVLPEDEAPLIDAMARLHAREQTETTGRLELDEGSRFLGSFRASGLLVPVWDLAPGTEADEIEDAAAAFRVRLDEALSEDAALTPAERRAREALRARQLTVH